MTKGGQPNQHASQGATSESSTSEMQSFSSEQATDNGSSSNVEAITNAKRFTVKSWSGVALWSWDTIVENCAICRNLIIDVCIECQPTLKQTDSGSGGVAMDGSKDEEGNCRIAWGVCQHAFHYHCISRWVRTRQVCPLDNRQWQFLAQ